MYCIVRRMSRDIVKGVVQAMGSFSHTILCSRVLCHLAGKAIGCEQGYIRGALRVAEALTSPPHRDLTPERVVHWVGVRYAWMLRKGVDE